MLRFPTLQSLCLVCVLVGGGAAARAGEVVFAEHLALSPDGQTLAFTWAGDIWTVASAGGVAQRLTVNPADDTAPVFSPDGAWLAFASARHGSANVFLMRRDGTDVRRLTISDDNEVPTGWSTDGTQVYFQTRREGDLYRAPRVYRVPAAGGQPWRLLDCFGGGVCASPDGKHVAFERTATPWWRRGYRGSGDSDVWIAAIDGSAFTQLTDFDGTDRAPCWDGTNAGVYFLSDRSGTVNVWHQKIGGAATQVTQMSADDVRDLAVSADGRRIAFTHWDRTYLLLPDAGPPQPLSIRAGDDSPDAPVDLRTFTRDADELAASPDGKELALVLHGEVFIASTEEERPTRRVTDSPARDHDLTWSPDGHALFFVSDRAGQEDIYRAVSAEEPAKALVDSLRFRVERVTDNPEVESHPSISPDGKHLAFLRTRGDLIVRDLASGAERVLLQSWNPSSFTWSPDSRWLAYEVEDRENNADVWIVPADGSGAAVNVSRHPDYDGNPQWSADGQVLAFSSRRAGFDTDVYLVFLSRALDEAPVFEQDQYFETQAEKVKKFKPPKKVTASEKIALGSATTQPATTQVTTTQSATTSAPTTATASAPTTAPTSAPTAAWRAWLGAQLRALIAEPEPAGHADGTKATKGADAAKSTKDEAGEEKDEKPAKTPEKTYTYNLDDAFRRLRRVTSLPGGESGFALAPDGAALVFQAKNEGEARLYTIKWNGQDRKQLVAGGTSAVQWGRDGKRLFYLKGGVPESCSATGGDGKTHKFSARLSIDRAAEAAQKFDDGARQIGLWFYHPTMKGLDWPKLTAKYRALALQTSTQFEFNNVFDMLLGELNGSHLGIYGPDRGAAERVGYLGCTFDPTFAGPGLKVAAVLPRSPAERDESRLTPGDVVLRVNGETVGPQAPLDRCLIDVVGEQVIVEIAPATPASQAATTAPDAASTPAVASSTPASAPTSAPATREVVIRPIARGTLVALQYDAWVDANRRYVEEHSHGRVGYLHIRGMDEGSFAVFERDLYAAGWDKDALIIDVRNNGGGWTADWVLAVLDVRRHAYTVQRGGVPGYPQDRLIFYSWTKPATMMCNEHSFSNAEIISHAFKNLQRGPLVGMTTYGGVISTGGYNLIDGALVRMPSRGWYTLPDGVDMECHGAVPDVLVPVGPADEQAGREPQLDAAIAATLAQLGAAQEPK